MQVLEAELLHGEVHELSCGQADDWPWLGTATREFLHYEDEPCLGSTQ